MPSGAEPQSPRSRARRLARAGGVSAALLMVWSLIAAPPLRSVEPPPPQTVQEPSDLSAYATFADAMPIQMYFDHQLRLVPLGPGIAHAQSDVSMPSQASSIAWLADMGIANGLHGTSTGTKVPTEAAAQQPNGEPEEEFKVAGGPIGDNDFIRTGAGRAAATARYGDVPRAYAAAHFANVAVLPAAGSPDDPGGTYDPGARFPGQTTDETDPAPRGQMAVLSIGKIASTVESYREGSKVVSIGVAELSDINIGNRTSDNRCANCIRIDSVRAEAYAEASGTKGGSKGGYRVIAGRACRRGLDQETGAERDQCLPLDPRRPQSSKGLQSVNELEGLNAELEKPFWTRMTGGAIDYTVGVRIYVGNEHRDPSRGGRTTTPPEDEHRNYAYPDTTPEDPENPKSAPRNPDRDGGEIAKAVAEAMEVEIWTITTSQIAGDGERRIEGTPAEQALREVDQDDATPGVQIDLPGGAGRAAGTQTIPLEQIRSVRRVQLALGVARANAVARPGSAAIVPEAPGAGGAIVGADPGMPGISSAPTAPDAPTATGGAPGGIGPGPLKMRVKWASMRVRPWPPYDMAKALSIAGMAFASFVIARRRFVG